MPRRQGIFAALLLLACLVVFAGCASGPYKPRKLDLPKEYPVYILPVKNLSGVPLAKLDPDLYYADNIEHLPMLAKAKTLSFPDLLHEAIAVVLRDEGFTVSDDPKSRLHVHLALSEWSAAELRERGEIWLAVDGVLVDSAFPEEPLMEARSKRWHQLLEGNPDAKGVLGTMRIITGAYNRIAIDAALDLLYQAGVIEPLESPQPIAPDATKSAKE